MDDQNLKMTDQQEKPAKAPGLRTTRMEAFSDGVFRDRDYAACARDCHTQRL
jgi:hypothetical protein